MTDSHVKSVCSMGRRPLDANFIDFHQINSMNSYTSVIIDHASQHHRHCHFISSNYGKTEEDVGQRHLTIVTIKRKQLNKRPVCEKVTLQTAAILNSAHCGVLLKLACRANLSVL